MYDGSDERLSAKDSWRRMAQVSIADWRVPWSVRFATVASWAVSMHLRKVSSRKNRVDSSRSSSRW